MFFVSHVITFRVNDCCVLCLKYTILIGVCQGVSLKNFRFYPEKVFVVHPVNVCGNVPLVSDDGDGFAVVVFESHLNHFVILLSYLHYTDGCDKSGQSQPLFSKKNKPTIMIAARMMVNNI